jgi:hypothetical protein
MLMKVILEVGGALYSAKESQPPEGSPADARAASPRKNTIVEGFMIGQQTACR